jgi:alpha/beta superfamily hydrolase
MSTKRVAIAGEESLEGVLREGAGAGVVVICHPHPLYGGSMWNNVVEAVEDAFFLAGYTTLKFNFRGVGASTGAYDGGEGEIRDVAAASAFARESIGGDGTLILAGYSFGAWVCTRAASSVGNVAGLFLVAYPFSIYDTRELLAFRGRTWLVGGSLDDISPLDSLLSVYRDLQTEKSLKIVPSSHFFEGKEPDIGDFIRERFGKKEG